MAPVIHGLIDPKKKAMVLQRIREGKAPLFMERKPASERRAETRAKQLNDELMDAAHWGNYGEVKALIRRGADVNARDGGLTPLMFATNRNRIEIIKLLIENGADVNVRDDNGDSVLTYTNNFHKDTLELLKQHGAK